LHYRAQPDATISEQNIVLAVNNLAQKLNATAFALTNLSEVATLRADLASHMPHFISSGDQGMSPLEAVYVMRVLLYQKVFNETFLMTPAERAALHERATPVSVESKKENNRMVTIHPRVQEMLALARKTGKLEVPTLIDTANKTLDDLGLDP